jgi:hypothetical protein
MGHDLPPCEGRHRYPRPVWLAGLLAISICATSTAVVGCGTDTGTAEDSAKGVTAPAERQTESTQDDGSRAQDEATCLEQLGDSDLIPVELYRCEAADIASREGVDVNEHVETLIAIDECTGIDPYKSYPGKQWGAALARIPAELRRTCYLEVTGLEPSEYYRSDGQPMP